MKYSIIGCGRIAPSHLSAAIKNNYDIVAVCDINPEAIDKLLEKCNLQEQNITRYADYKEMIENEKPQIVAVSTESGKHVEIARYVIKKNIALILEKPMTLSITEAEDLISMAEKHHVPFAVCQQNRYNVSTQLVKKAIDAGYFGKISHIALTIRWARGRHYFEQGDWRGTWEQDGGTLMNQCIHGCDLLRWFGNTKINTVSGHLYNQFHPYLEVEDLGLATVCFTNGIIGTIEGTSNTYNKDLEETITIFGENGIVRLNGIVAEMIDVWDFKEQEAMELRHLEKTKKYQSVYGNSHENVYADFLEAIQENRAPYVDGHCGKDALELVLAIYKSHKEGKAISLPLEKFSTIDMKGTIL
jgi:predicted dehydrogenase